MENNIETGINIQEKGISVSKKKSTGPDLVKWEFSSHRQKIISGPFQRLLNVFLTLHRALFILKHYRNPKVGLQTLKALMRLKKSVLGANRISKMVKVGGSYYWDLYTPGWPSQTFKNFLRGEMNRINPIRGKANRFTNIFIAITKKCSLQCEHCFEWEALNGKEKLSMDDLKNIVLQLHERGVSQIQLSGGEPMLRLNDMLELIKTSPKEIDFWVLTSGLNVTAENAKKLKNSGATGVVVSLDHFDPEQHNKFRGSKKSFEWVQKAVKNSVESNLVTSLSLCVTKEFVSESNLMAYAELAKNMGVAFVQILEPKAVGHYQGLDVLLKAEHKKVLDAFYSKINFDKVYRKYPMIIYHGYYQREVGCFASANRSVYIDTDGDIHACPFCRTKRGNALSQDLDTLIENVRQEGCHSFKSFPG